MARQPPCQQPALLRSLSLKLHVLRCPLQARQEACAPLKTRIAALSQQLRVANQELQAAEQRAEAGDGELQHARLRAVRAENLVSRAEERRAGAEQECSRLQGASGKLQQQVGCALEWAGRAVSGCAWPSAQHDVEQFTGHDRQGINKLDLGWKDLERCSGRQGCCVQHEIAAFGANKLPGAAPLSLDALFICSGAGKKYQSAAGCVLQSAG